MDNLAYFLSRNGTIWLQICLFFAFFCQKVPKKACFTDNLSVKYPCKRTKSPISAMTNTTTSTVSTTAGTLALAAYSASILGIKLDAALISDPKLLAQRVAEALANRASKPATEQTSTTVTA